MKQITYNGEPLVTGTDVSDALVHYVTHVAATASAVAIDVPVLEKDGTVQTHTVLLSVATQLKVVDVAGSTTDDELARFPVPEFPPIGGQGYAVAPHDIEEDAPFIDDDFLNLDGDSHQQAPFNDNRPGAA
jgi:hypothetical protein